MSERQLAFRAKGAAKGATTWRDYLTEPLMTNGSRPECVTAGDATSRLVIDIQASTSLATTTTVPRTADTSQTRPRGLNYMALRFWPVGRTAAAREMERAASALLRLMW
jgi:hypothetical protein